LDNILKNPDDEKYRKIKQENKVFQVPCPVNVFKFSIEPNRRMKGGA
jgi:predicted nucleotide-binding protein